MDFGIVTFIDNATINPNFTMQFKNGVTYCVAPVTLLGTQPSSYDFWAVGVDCCSSKSFSCGDTNLMYAHSGLRVTSEHQRQFYHVAVRQAAAAYNIPVHNPIFFEWVAKPSEYIAEQPKVGVKLVFLKSAKLFFVEFMLIAVAFIPVLWAQSLNELSEFDWSEYTAFLKRRQRP